MKLHEYATLDATAQADLVARGDVRPRELAALAAQAIARANPQLGAVVETYADRIESLDESTLGQGPFRGVPMLMKDVFGHEAGRLVEFGSRLCRGMVSTDETAVCRMFKQAGFNLIGRSAAPEYSMAGTTESAMFGNTSTPWRAGYSAGGSSGGAASAVAAGLVPLAHGSDIAGSVRIPASFCGGVGLKPSRGRVSYAPLVDENGYGLGQNFVQTRSLRDTAALLDVLSEPQVGDPFAIPRPSGSWLQAMAATPPRLRVAFSTAGSMGVEPDPEVAEAVRVTARWMQQQGHEVHEFTPPCDLRLAQRHMLDLWFFGFPERLAGYSQRSGHPVDDAHLEPVIQLVLAHAQQLRAADMMAAFAGLNRARRQLGVLWTQCDLWITPTTARVAEPWGRYHLGRTGLSFEDLVDEIYAPTTQHTLPHNVMGTPALSLPLVMHSQGLPIGVQLSAPPAEEARLLQLGALLEQAMPWALRVPPLHVTRLAT